MPIPTDTDWEETTNKFQSTVPTEPKFTTVKGMDSWELTEMEVNLCFILGSEPNYEPNSYKGVNTFAVDKDARFEPYRVTGLVARHRPNHPNCDFSQPGTLFRKVMTDRDR